MDNLNRPQTPFWIPVWLYVPMLLEPDGNPRPALRGLHTLDGWFFWLFLILSIVTGVVLNFSWKKVDVHLCPNIISCTNPCFVEADPDITGIGVRIATYIQAFCGTILLGFSSEDTVNVRATIIVSSLTLVATTSIYALRGQLSLHHAVIVKALLTLILLPMHIVEPWRVRSPALFFAQQIRFGAYVALSLWLSIKTPCLGSDPQCNMCTRRAGLFTTWPASRYFYRSLDVSILLIVVVFWAHAQWWNYGLGHYILTVPALLSETKARDWKRYVWTTQRTLFDWRDRRIKIYPFWISFPRFFFWFEHDSTVSAQLKARRRAHTAGPHTTKSRWLRRVWDDSILTTRVPRAQRAMIGVALIVRWAIATEWMVKTNVTQNANEWGFGQISALILSVPAVASLVKLLLRLGREDRTLKPAKRIYTFP